jgi:hypothetical protein
MIPFAVSSILFLWASSDARRRGRPLPLTARTWIFVFAPMAVTLYLMRTRGWRGMGLAVANWLGCLALSTIVMHLGGYLWFGDDWLAALRSRS